MKKKICCLLGVVLLLSGCGKIPTLKDGKEALVTFNNEEMISVDELYEDMKNTYALSSLMNLIDKYVLETTFPDYIEKAKEYATSYIEALKSNYESDDELLQAIQQYTGMNSIEAYENALYLSYMQTNAAEEYAKSTITEKQINKYYKDEVVGDIEVSHILITPDVTDEMTDEEIEKAENAAKKQAEDIIAKLKKAKKVKTTWSELVTKYSKDASTIEKDGSLGKLNKTTTDETMKKIVDAAYSIKDGKYYSKVITAEDGYHVIMRVKTYDKAPLEDMKDSIINTLKEELLNNDSTISIKALQNYRKALGMEIVDSELHTQYAYYIQNSLAKANK